MIKLLVFASILVLCHAGLPSPTPPPRVYCGETPEKTFMCLGSPRVIDHAASMKCIDIESSECDKIKCIFSESGWLDGEQVNRAKVSAHFERFAVEHPTWAPAVAALKGHCFEALPPQGTELNCPAYDVMHCITGSFVKNASPAQWTSSSECVSAKAYAGACPYCPSSCFAPAIPIGSCNACYH